MRALIFFIVFFFLLPFLNAGPVCSISVNASSIDFGTVAPQGTSDPVKIRITNSGTISAPLSVNSGDWSDGVHTMPVGITRGSILPTYSYDSAVPLASQLTQVVSSLPIGISVDVFLGVRIPQDSYAGTYTQTITLTLGC